MDEALEFSLTVMGDADLDEVLAIERSSYPFPWSDGVFRDCLNAGYNGHVLRQAGSLVAYVLTSVSAAVGEAHLLNLCVSPDFRRQGLGQMLLGHVVNDVRINGADVLLLEVRASNKAAITLYYEAGFNELAVRHDYYPAKKGREDALVMARQL